MGRDPRDSSKDRSTWGTTIDTTLHDIVTGVAPSQADELMVITSAGLECDYVSRRKYNELHAKLVSAEYELEQSRKLALMAKVERDTAISERNMALQALVKMVETRLLASRKAAAEAETPGAQMLRAIAVDQKTNRVR